MNITVIGDKFCRVKKTCNSSDKLYAAPKDCRCWHCTNLISNVTDHPIPLPVDYDERKALYTITGHFCSVGCMMAYSSLAKKTGLTRVGNGLYLFQFLKDLTGNTDPSKIPIAPPRELLACFGGYMTYEEFYAQFEQFTYTKLPKNCILKEEILLQKSKPAETRKTRGNRTSIRSMLISNEHVGNHSETIRVTKRKDVLLKNKSVDDDVKDLRQQLLPENKEKTLLEKMLES